MYVTGRIWHTSQVSHVYDHESTSVRNRGPEIEWPIASHLRKHIFVPQKKTESKHINIDAIRLERRVEWTWALRKDSTRLPSIHIKSHETASCSKLIPPIVECWTAGIRIAIMNAARKGVLKGDQQSLHERDVATEMGEAKTSNIAVDSSAESRGRGVRDVRSTTSQRSTRSRS